MHSRGVSHPKRKDEEFMYKLFGSRNFTFSNFSWKYSLWNNWPKFK